jgi:Fe-S cluster assembly protein SufD
MALEIDSNTIKYKLISLFQQYEEAITNDMPDAMNQYRKKAIGFFEQEGIPAKGTELYKYSDMMQAYGHQYGYAFNAGAGKIDPKTIFQCSVPDLDTYTLIVENGWFYHDNDSIAKLPANVVATSIETGAKLFPELFKEWYNKQASQAKNSLIELNTAFTKSGYFLYIPDGVVIEKPIQIINLLTGNNNLMVNQRNMVVVGKNSQSKLVICDHTLTNQLFLTNSVTEIIVSENAVFDYYNIQNQHNQSSQIKSVFIHQEKCSNTHTNTLTLHGGFIRNNIQVTLAGEYAEANVYGLALPDGKQHVDNYTFIDHAVPNCHSNEMYKNILKDESTGAFNGRIMVRKDAQKTQAYQSNKNICLTPTARMNTKPQLEIYADDVKCSHGATVGRLDENALFYLKARGIGHDEARMMLMYAFAHEIIKEIRIPVLAERYAELVDKRLRGQFSQCEGCFVHCR